MCACERWACFGIVERFIVAVVRSAIIELAVVLVAPWLALACGAGSPPDRPEAVGPNGGDGDGVGALGWLAGTWRAEDAARRTVEVWTRPRGGVLYGFSYTEERGLEVTHHEVLRIDRDGEQIRYVASPEGQATTAFALTSVTAARATFENAAHDFPTRIDYARAGDALTARVSGGDRAFELRYAHAAEPVAPRPVAARVCRTAEDMLEITAAPCFCSATTFCAVHADDVQAVIVDRACDACLEAEITCALDAGALGARPLRAYGMPIGEAPLAVGECYEGPFPVLASGP